MLKKLFGGASAVTRRQLDPRWWVTPDLAPGKFVEVVGESHYQDAIRVAHDTCGRPQLGELVREPQNRHDRNAVAVQLLGRTVGYLRSDEAVRWHRVLDELGGVATVRASVTGGWNETYHWGVILHATPGRYNPALGLLGGDQRVPLTTSKALKEPALAALTGTSSTLATLTVDDEGLVWAFVGDVPLGKMAKAKSEMLAGPVQAAARIGVAPTCPVHVDVKDDGTPKIVASVWPVGETWADLR